jgi:Protein of unknown function (DUF2924)
MARDKTAERDQLSAEIAALLSETTFQLRERWKALYGTEPPPRVSRDLMKRAVACRIQERLLGGLRVSTRRLVERIAEDAVARRPARPRRRAAKVRLRLHQAGVQHGSLLLTAPPRTEIRTPNPRRVVDVTGFRASAWRTKRTTNSLQHQCFYSGRILRQTRAEFRPDKP